MATLVETPFQLSFQNPSLIPQQPQVQTRKKKIYCKQELIVNSLQKFYAERDDLHEVLPLLQGTSEISLRLIDWFVTNYAKRHSTSYILENQEFVVYNNYKSQLKAYSKKLFDPFCRRERILFQIPGTEPFLTTVGKLNFFRWAIEKNVITYLKLHSQSIESEMNKTMREQTKQRSNTASTQSSVDTTTTITTTTTSSSTGSRGTRRRQCAKETLSIKQMQKHDMPIEMRFD